METFNTLELFALLFALAIVVFAFLRGAMYELMQIFAWTIGIGLATALFPYIRPWVGSVIESGLFADFLAITIVVAPIALLSSRYGRKLHSELGNANLSVLNRTLGVGFGMVRAMIMVWLVAGVVTWSFFRSVDQVYAAQDQGKSAQEVEIVLGAVPVADILCGEIAPPSRTNQARLERARDTLSPLLRDIWAFHQDPEAFPFLNGIRTLSVSICSR